MHATPPRPPSGRGRITSSAVPPCAAFPKQRCQKWKVCNPDYCFAEHCKMGLTTPMSVAYPENAPPDGQH